MNLKTNKITIFYSTVGACLIFSFLDLRFLIVATASVFFYIMYVNLKLVEFIEIQDKVNTSLKADLDVEYKNQEVIINLVDSTRKDFTTRMKEFDKKIQYGQKKEINRK